jgi:5'-nucleotidase (lipoprotein e(P4) family)
MRRWMMFATVALLGTVLVHAQAPGAAHETGIKYMRDSEEYAALARQTYRLAADAVQRAGQGIGRQPWVVILDIDETALDNSTYELERAAYGQPFESASWNAWVRRQAAGAVPGVVDFVATVRRAHGRIAWISDRDAATLDATRVNLRAVGMWSDDDRLCLQDRPERTKRIRRAEVVSGTGACAWPGTPVRAVAFLGDQMGDFPDASEHIPDTGTDAAFGRTCFLLPNSMYGQWTTRVTREPLR